MYTPSVPINLHNMTDKNSFAQVCSINTVTSYNYHKYRRRLCCPTSPYESEHINKAECKTCFPRQVKSLPITCVQCLFTNSFWPRMSYPTVDSVTEAATLEDDYMLPQDHINNRLPHNQGSRGALEHTGYR